MIHRDFVALTDAAWIQKAAEARRLVLSEYAQAKAEKRDPDKKIFKDSIWGDLKDLLKEVFKQKCGYCEAHFDHVSFGAVEHYRPKRRVDEVGADGKVRPLAGHRGYYWLAYEPSNLLPSCDRCNGPGGKMNLFPLEGSEQRVFDPNESLDRERPLLLNPYKDQPGEHLVFDGKNGTVGALTLRGERSIQVYRLDREARSTKRQEAQEFLRLRLKEKLSSTDLAGMQEEIRNTYGGDGEFSASLCAQIGPTKDFVKKLSDLFASA